MMVQADTAVAICAIVKNEAPHIVEWIAYHRLIGVRKFYIYDNDSTDGTRDLLAPLVRAGIVDLTSWPRNPGQLQAYDDYIVRHRDEWTWTAFIDADEFINLLDVDTIEDWLERFPGASGVTVQWMNFGPSGHEQAARDMTIASFTQRLAWDNPVHGHVKTIVRNRDVVRPITPHSFVTRGVVVNERGDPVIFTGDDYAIQPVIEHTDICLNHYYTRSREDWVAKVGRGMADSARDAPNRRDLAWFDDYLRDANVEDLRLASRARLVGAEIDRLKGLI